MICLNLAIRDSSRGTWERALLMGTYIPSYLCSGIDTDWRCCLGAKRSVVVKTVMVVETYTVVLHH